jgi:hypothetical protein
MNIATSTNETLISTSLNLKVMTLVFSALFPLSYFIPRQTISNYCELSTVNIITRFSLFFD